MENSGLTVSQVIDTQDMKVTAYLTYKDATVPSGRKTEFLQGKFEYINNEIDLYNGPALRLVLRQQ